MSIHSWKEQFGHKVTGYDAVEANGLSELGFALKHNQILQDEYLSWARAKFEMCSLDMKFFQTRKAPLKLFERVKEVYPWSAECLPVAEWDNHLIIAGLEKPQDIPPEYNPIFLLAPLSGLELYWEALHQEKAEGAEDSEETVEPSVVSAMPDGFDVASASAKVNFAELTKSGTSPFQPKEVKAKPIMLEVDATEVPERPPIIEVEKKAEPRVVAIASPNAPVDESDLMAALALYKHHYEKRAFVHFDHEKKEFLASLFPPDYILTEKPTPHSLEADSIFRIISRTQKAYHGYPVKNATNEAFFKEINKGQLPENLTAIPLINQEQIIGVFLGWGDKTTYTLTVLRDIQKIVDELSTKLGWVKVEAA